jgi:hypothetical protein
VSDNPSSAENQQERPITTDWIVGFVDGEGCFSLSLVRQANRGNRKGYKTGWQVVPRFAVTQGERSREALESLREFFGVGTIYYNRRRDNHKEDLLRYDVSRLDELTRVIVPFFSANPLRTAKRFDFNQFKSCLEIIAKGEHIRPDGLISILELMQTMNHRKSREDVIGILRDHTPNIPIRDEDMVPAAWRHAGVMIKE